jgi:hypothetical protein
MVKFLDAFYNDGKFIIYFIILSIIIMAISKDTLFYFLLLILIGQLIFNFELIEKILPKEEENK